MKNYFYNINKKYIAEFSRRARERFLDFNIRSDTNFIRSIFIQLNDLFQKIGGRVTSKNDIPQIDEFPDSAQHNRMVNNIGSDINKLFKSQKLVEDDVNNLLNFNSIQRIKTFENMSRVQQKVYSLFVRNQQGISGQRIQEVSFNSTSLIGPDSSNVKIDEDRGILTLYYDSTTTKPVDSENVMVFFYGDKPKGPLYPNSQAGTETNNMHPGSHWQRFSTDPHFIDTTDPTELRSYKTMLIDDPNRNTGIGWCEFEAVKTILDPSRNTRNALLNERRDLLRSIKFNLFSLLFSGRRRKLFELANIESKLMSLKQTDLVELKKELGEYLNIDSNLIHLDYENSLQHEYAKYGIDEIDNPEVRGQQFKIVIPFINAPITNEITISLRSNEEPGDEDGGIIPSVMWTESKVWSGGSSYALVPPSDLSDTVINDGEYVCKIVNHVVPDRLELVVSYHGNQWQPLPFYMAHYIYSMNKNYQLPSIGDSPVSLTLGKTYDIFVDTEPRQDLESRRAVSVLLSPGRRIS